MRHYEADEASKYHGGYDPSDPPENPDFRWCSECQSWDEGTGCDCPEEANFPAQGVSLVNQNQDVL